MVTLFIKPYIDTRLSNPVVYDMVHYFQISGQLDGTSGRCRILWDHLDA